MTLEYQFDDKENQIFSPLLNKWLKYTLEEEVRQKFICTLVNDYGYSLNQMAQEVAVTNSSRGTGRSRADIVIWKTAQDKNECNHAGIVIECKSDNVTIAPSDYYQGLNYATWARAKFFVTHNSKETRYFQVADNKLPAHLGKEIADIPNARQLLDDEEVKKILTEEKVFEKDEFAKLLHQCHNIIRNNDKLSPEACFDEISKILFTKIVFERENKNNNNSTQIFSKQEFEKQEQNFIKNIRPYLQGEDRNTDYLQFIFRRTKENYTKETLFSDDDVIKIRRESFLAIVEKLQIYNLSKTSDDVKGIAFEQFLGATFRGELGQYFTPRTVVEFMTEVLDPVEGERVCDPCCGSGGFLINAFEFIREKMIADIELQKAKIKEQYFNEEYENADENKKVVIENQVDELFKELNDELNLDNSNSRLYHLSHNCIFGTDANPRMARVSKMNMIMHGDGHGGVHHNDGLLNINGIFEERFDVILTNPPFGSSVSKNLKLTSEDDLTAKAHYLDWLDKYPNYQQISDERKQEIKNGTAIIDKFDVGQFSGLTEVLFMERCLRLLKKGGRMAIVLPEGVLNNANLQKVREYFEGKAKILLIASLPADVFNSAKATVKTSVLFMKRFTKNEEILYQQIAEQATQEVKRKYQAKIDELAAILGEKVLTSKASKNASDEEKSQIKSENKRLQDELKAKKVQAKSDLKQLEIQIQSEVRQGIKERFDYEIALAEISDAGIDSTGKPTNANQLPILKVEFEKYRKRNQLWENGGV
ncbi:MULTISPECIES: N-6 DNA methylase [unclassified Mannheimia]|uniref:N-6 DNA methylase n=1 Tax=unclassified Mannheimia TaxID=2645054 RepID=UPI00359DD1E9